VFETTASAGWAIGAAHEDYRERAASLIP
jgi:hypothetical protein